MKVAKKVKKVVKKVTLKEGVSCNECAGSGIGSPSGDQCGHCQGKGHK